MARIVSVSDTRIQRLDGWEFACITPDRAPDPESLERLAPTWQPAPVPGTVAGAGGINPSELDSLDTWYRTRFVAPERPYTLRLGGLATFAEVWLDGKHLLSSDNMFVSHELSIREALGRTVELAIRFRAFREMTKERSPRPRWRARSLESGGIRWARSTLSGRIPGLGPAIPTIGPWRPIEIVDHGPVRVSSARLATRCDQRGGSLLAHLVLAPMAGKLQQAVLRIGSVRARMEVSNSSDGTTWLSGALRLLNAERWWPHTHGAQPLYSVRVELEVSGRKVAIDLGKTGFRSLELSTASGQFALSVNGVPIFCRGACWLPLDPISLDAPNEVIDRALLSARDAGMNMLRVAAQGIYESDHFFDRAAELGILIWQDFLFSRLDYPTTPEFIRSVEREARDLVGRTEHCPAVAMFCGNSEVEQQAAMLGIDPALARSELFGRVLPEIVAELRPDVPYVASSPSGGAMPFHVDTGVGHYFGVGAYLRPVSDVRSSNLRFASECLAFSNVPERKLLDRVLGGQPPGSNSAWKSIIPHDGGASWDFEDVRDHYLETLFRLDARQLRASDPERWLELGRIATGEIMSQTIAELRRNDSSCRGALIWHLRDLVPGAGCGLIDATGNPKAAYWFVERAFRPLALFLIDEGLNGLHAHAINETEHALSGELVVSFFRDGRTRVDQAISTLALPPRSSVQISVDAMLGHFIDSTYAYRFGPPNHDLTTASLVERPSGRMLAEAVHFPLGPPAIRRSDLELMGGLEPHARGFVLSLSANAFAYAVAVDAEGYEASENYFHLVPDAAKRVLLSATSESLPEIKVRITALNAPSALTLKAAKPSRAQQETRRSA